MKDSGKKSHTRSHTVFNFRYSNTRPRPMSITPFPLGFSLSTLLFLPYKLHPRIHQRTVLSFSPLTWSFNYPFFFHNHGTESEDHLQWRRKVLAS
jgi:hypothetical protein